MGNFLFKKADPMRILIQGLDAAGKTSILYRLKIGEVVTTIPTIGFNVETVSVKGVDITCWDVGGRDKIRPLYRHYYANTTGFVFVVDSADHERLDFAFDEFIRFCLQEEETKGTVVMVLANKQDLPEALTCEELEKKFRKKCPTTPDHKVLFRPTSVMSGEGLFEAFEDFVSEIKANREDPCASKAKEEQKSIEGKQGTSLKLFIKSPLSFVKSLLLY
ncbi:ADP-ribosylation factor 1 [Aplysia californica]|uniref:ADP-ribosylation factor 1 n=1 Tax=Aplysia californica TaxID=6500 RepID=A0ABM0K3E8_APLCA|nr:ADP-ribosylation factor 1 [Aplysia californica]